MARARGWGQEEPPGRRPHLFPLCRPGMPPGADQAPARAHQLPEPRQQGILEAPLPCWQRPSESEKGVRAWKEKGSRGKNAELELPRSGRGTHLRSRQYCCFELSPPESTSVKVSQRTKEVWRKRAIQSLEAFSMPNNSKLVKLG